LIFAPNQSSAGPVRVNLVEFGTSAADPVYPD
jgi:hypothetical protein